MRYVAVVSEIGLRELRQNASDVVRRVEAGETVTITVSGRAAAVLSPVPAPTWRTWAEVEDVLRAPLDPDWARDRERIDQNPVDPGTRP